jgi:hypothetical protein
MPGITQQHRPPPHLRGRPRATCRPDSPRGRAFVESVRADVLARVGRATGAGPLRHDERHARDTADLTVSLRRHHAERSLAEPGGLTARKESS